MEFHFRTPRGDRRHYVDEADVAVVLARLPTELTAPIRGIHFTDDGAANRCLGYTTTRGRREIALCALPPHVSLNAYIVGPKTALTFGAVKGSQWPCLAVRRFMLYDTLLHEIGHLQIVDARARSARRKYADETHAHDFANRWREDLWSIPFSHPDPVHNAPSAEETAALAGWSEAHAEYKRGVGAPRAVARGLFERAVALFPSHSLALTALARSIVREAELENRPMAPARERAIELLLRALVVDPVGVSANYAMGWYCGDLGRLDDARRHLERALRAFRLSAGSMSLLGAAYAEWGLLHEAERLFQKALALEPDDTKILRSYARALWDLGAHTPEVTARALSLFERAVTAGPNSGLSHFYFARALAAIPGETRKALQHAERALEIRPNDPKVAELVARLREPLPPEEGAHLQRPLVQETIEPPV